MDELGFIPFSATGAQLIFQFCSTPRHVHDVDQVFLFVQGQGVIPIDGVEYPVQTGDVVIVEAGEDHHTRSSEDDPLVAAWWVMEK